MAKLGKIATFMEDEMTREVLDLLAQLRPMLEQIRPEAEEAVRMVEAKPEIYRNHYADYMTVISQMEKRPHKFILAIAMIKAGGNKEGIETAMKLLGLFD